MLPTRCPTHRAFEDYHIDSVVVARQKAFRAGLPRPSLRGGPFPDFFLNNAGAVGHTITTLDAGEYIVWAELASDDEDAPGEIIAVPLTVGEGDDDAVIPATDGGSIRAGDYLFDADVTAGGTSVTFTNSSDNQFHHVALMDFGTNDPALVEEILPAFLESEEDAPPPEGIDMEQVNPDFAVLAGLRTGFERHVRSSVRGGAHLCRDVLHPGP